MRVREAIADAARRLGDISETPRLDAELIMAAAMDISRDELLLHQGEAEAPAAFASLLARRMAHEPVAYIIGRRAFWTIELAVGPGVLVPRPDSETLIEAAVDHFGARAPATILDLGTGPGTLLLAALAQWPKAHGLGIDSEEKALEYARCNARALGLEERAGLRLGNWADGLAGRFDLILCNPPYIAVGTELAPDVADFEPETSLYAGPDGLDAYRMLAAQLPPLIAPGGIACIELGAGQEQAVRALFSGARVAVSSRLDLGGIGRCLILRA
jgi:release factor glutamine methyltransferase